MNQTEPKAYLFFGPSGAGKGTQVQLLKEHLEKTTDRKVIYIGMGDLLRGLAATGAYSATLTDNIIANGGLMPSFMPVYLMTKLLVEKFTGGEHIIADGVVRRPGQARAFDDAMKFYERENYEILVLELSPESTMKRLLLRKRSDDSEESIKKRIGWYKDEVEPLLEVFKERERTIHYVDGEPSIEEVHDTILKTLKLA